MKELLQKFQTFDFSFAEQIYIMLGMMFLVVLVCLILVLVLSVKYRRLRKFVEQGEPIEETIDELKEDDFFEEGKGEAVTVSTYSDEKIGEIELNQQKYFDIIKVLRYNHNSPSGKTMSDFSIGITNAKCDGIVLTGMETESGATQLTVKSIKDGKSNIELTEAEKAAVVRKGEKTC